MPRQRVKKPPWRLTGPSARWRKDSFLQHAGTITGDKNEHTWLPRQQLCCHNTVTYTNALTSNMSGRFTYSQRSKEAPMDFTWTNRSPVKPVWAPGSEEQNTPCKRRSSLMLSLKLKLHIQRRLSWRDEPSPFIVGHTSTVYIRHQP